MFLLLELYIQFFSCGVSDAQSSDIRIGVYNPIIFFIHTNFIPIMFFLIELLFPNSSSVHSDSSELLITSFEEF